MEDTRFKRGDKVRVRDYLDLRDTYGVRPGSELLAVGSPGFSKDMELLCGQGAVVLEVISKSAGWYHLDGISSEKSNNGFSGWKFSDAMLEPYTKPEIIGLSEFLGVV